MRSMARIGASIVALVALSGLVVQFAATFAQTGSVGETLWTLARFFTVLANVAVVLAFGGIAFGRPVSARMIGGVVLAILLVGVTYGLLLRGLLSLSGGALLADTLLHKVAPVLAPLWWFFFAPKRRLDGRAPWAWALWPACYLVYALVRGAMEGRYPYPFIDVGALGYARVLINSVAIGFCFILAGFAMVLIDRRR